MEPSELLSPSSFVRPRVMSVSFSVSETPPRRASVFSADDSLSATHLTMTIPRDDIDASVRSSDGGSTPSLRSPVLEASRAPVPSKSEVPRSRRRSSGSPRLRASATPSAKTNSRHFRNKVASFFDDLSINADFERRCELRADIEEEKLKLKDYLRKKAMERPGGMDDDTILFIQDANHSELVQRVAELEGAGSNRNVVIGGSLAERISRAKSKGAGKGHTHRQNVGAIGRSGSPASRLANVGKPTGGAFPFNSKPQPYAMGLDDIYKHLGVGGGAKKTPTSTGPKVPVAAAAAVAASPRTPTPTGARRLPPKKQSTVVSPEPQMQQKASPTPIAADRRGTPSSSPTPRPRPDWNSSPSPSSSRRKPVDSFTALCRNAGTAHAPTRRPLQASYAPPAISATREAATTRGCYDADEQLMFDDSANDIENDIETVVGDIALRKDGKAVYLTPQEQRRVKDYVTAQHRLRQLEYEDDTRIRHGLAEQHAKDIEDVSELVAANEAGSPGLIKAAIAFASAGNDASMSATTKSVRLKPASRPPWTKMHVPFPTKNHYTDPATTVRRRSPPMLENETVHSLASRKASRAAATRHRAASPEDRFAFQTESSGNHRRSDRNHNEVLRAAPTFQVMADGSPGPATAPPGGLGMRHGSPADAGSMRYHPGGRKTVNQAQREVEEKLGGEGTTPMPDPFTQNNAEYEQHMRTMMQQGESPPIPTVEEEDDVNDPGRFTMSNFRPL